MHFKCSSNRFCDIHNIDQTKYGLKRIRVSFTCSRTINMYTSILIPIYTTSLSRSPEVLPVGHLVYQIVCCGVQWWKSDAFSYKWLLVVIILFNWGAVYSRVYLPLFPGCSDSHINYKFIKDERIIKGKIMYTFNKQYLFIRGWNITGN